MVKFSGLHISWCRLERGHRKYRWRQTELSTDRHFLDLSETCLHMVHFGLRRFYRPSLHRFTKRNQKVLLSLYTYTYSQGCLDTTVLRVEQSTSSVVSNTSIRFFTFDMSFNLVHRRDIDLTKKCVIVCVYVCVCVCVHVYVCMCVKIQCNIFVKFLQK